MIEIRDIKGDLRYSVELSDRDVYHKELMAEEYILLAFNTDKLIHFRKGDYIETEYGKFEILIVSKPTIDNSTGGYSYEQKFVPSWAKWSTRTLMYDRQNVKEVSFKITQTPSFFLNLVVSNLSALGFGIYTYEIDASLTEMKFIEFDSVKITDALTLIAEAWETEWWITDNIIHLSKCEYGTEIELKKGDSLQDMQREDSQDTDYITRLYAFGGERNIPKDYRKQEGVTVEGVVQKRLHLPAGIDYVDAWENMADEDVVEGVVILDNIYPKRIGTISAISTKVYVDEQENEEGPATKEEWNAYRFKDAGLQFKKEYLIDEQELRVTFQTGKMAGMDFAVIFNPDGKKETEAESQLFEIIRNEDYGINLPSDTFHPEVDDTYVLYGFNTKFIDAQLLPAAEQELLVEAKKVVAKKSEDKSVYNCPTNPIWCAGYREVNGSLVYRQQDEIDLQIGQKVKLVNEIQFSEGYRISRVRMFEKRLDNKFNCVYLVGNESSYSKTGELTEKLDALTYQTKQFVSSGGSSIYVIKRYDSTIANDFNVYSALRQKIEFLSKKYDDIAQGLITFMKGANFGEFAGGITGFGGRIDGLGNGELESLKLRRFLEVPEFRYNRVTIQIGNKWNAAGGGIIERCVPDLDEQGKPLMSGTAYLHLEEGEIGTIEVDDICQGIFHDGMKLDNNSAESFDDGLGNFKFTGFFTAYFRVTEIIDKVHNSSFRYSLRGVSERWKHTFHPCEAMHFVGYGTFDLKNHPERAYSRYSTRTYERYLRNVNDWEFTAENIGAQFGDLSNLSIFGMNMEGYSAYLNNIYMSGVIEQFEHLELRMDIDTEGDSTLAYGEHLHVTCKVFKGWEDLTSKVERWQIIRDSGFASEDAAWALRPKVKNFAGVIDIHLDSDASVDDLGKSEISTLFTFKAFFKDKKDPVIKQLVI